MENLKDLPVEKLIVSLPHMIRTKLIKWIGDQLDRPNRSGQSLRGDAGSDRYRAAYSGEYTADAQRVSSC